MGPEPTGEKNKGDQYIQKNKLEFEFYNYNFCNYPTPHLPNKIWKVKPTETKGAGTQTSPTRVW